MNKNSKIQNEQAVTEPTVEQAIDQAIQEVDQATEAKVEATESKAERVVKLLLKLKEAKAAKDDRAGKKIRRQLRKLGYYISKQPKPDTI